MGWEYLPRSEYDSKRKKWCNHEDRPASRSTGYKGDFWAEEGGIWKCKCGKRWVVESIGATFGGTRLSTHINWREIPRARGLTKFLW